MVNDNRREWRCPYGASERGLVAVLTALLLAVLFGALALALNHTYSLILQREMRTAVDAAAHAATVSLCATVACWEDAKDAAINTLKNHLVHGRLGDATQIKLDPANGPLWEDPVNNWKVSIERGRWLPGGTFQSLEPTPAMTLQGLTPLYLAANAVRVKVERPSLSFIAAPSWIGGGEAGYDLNVRTTALKGRPEVSCVAPFAIPVCALVHDRAFQKGGLASADRFFMRTSRFCDQPTPGSPACKQIVPEFFYQPTNDTAAPPVVVNAPECSWSNAHFEDPSDHFGVVGLPESAAASGSVTEQRVREVLENASRPCVRATLGEKFLVLEGGLTETASDEALWRQISVSYDGLDYSHPAFSSVYKNITVSTKEHDYASCASASDHGWGACNSWRYVYNGVRGRTYFAADRFAHGLMPQSKENNVTWPAVNEDTPLWRVQVPVIAPEGATVLNCPGGTAAGAEDPSVDSHLTYEVIGFLPVNLFDSDIAAAPPLSPTQIADTYGWGESGSDRVWGLNRARDTNPTGPTCYPGGAGTASECAPCNLVRGRVAREIDYLATDQEGEPLVNLVFDRDSGRGA